MSAASIFPRLPGNKVFVFDRKDFFNFPTLEIVFGVSAQLSCFVDDPGRNIFGGVLTTFFWSFGSSEISILTNFDNKISSGNKLWLLVLRNDLGRGSVLNFVAVFCFFKLFSGTWVTVNIGSEIFSVQSSVFFTILSVYLSQSTFEICKGSLADVLHLDKTLELSNFTEVFDLLKDLLC